MAVGSSFALELGDAADYDDAPAGKLRLGVDTTGGLFTKDELGNIQFYGVEGVEDIVGGMFIDTATIDFTYNDVAGEITADLKDGSVTTPKMGLTAGTLTLPNSLNVALGTGAGTQWGTGPTQTQGWYGATPVAQIAGNTDVLAGMVTQGFRAASSNPPLNLGTGALTAGTTNVGALSATSIAATGTVAVTGTVTFSEGVDVALGTVTGTKWGTDPLQKQAWWNATPVVQPAGSTDVLASMVTLGLRAASSNPPLNLGSGAITAGSLTAATGLGGGTGGFFVGDVGAGSSSYYGVAHTSMATTTGYALIQNNLGQTAVNAATGQSVSLGINNSVKLTLAATTLTFADAVNMVFNATTGTKIGTTTTGKIGFFNATPVAQISGSTDLLAGFVTLGLRAASSNPPLNLGTGLITAGSTTWSNGSAVVAAVGTTGVITVGDPAGGGVAQLLADGTVVLQKSGSTGDIFKFFSLGTVLGQVATAAQGNLIKSRVMDTLTKPATTIDGYAGLTGPILRLRDSAAAVTLDITPTGLTFGDVKDITFNTGTGTKIGTATGQKIGIWNATPIVQPTRVGPIVDNSTGTSTSPTIPLVAAAGVDTTAASLTTTRNAVASLAAAIAALETRLSAAAGGIGITA